MHREAPNTATLDVVSVFGLSQRTRITRQERGVAYVTACGHARTTYAWTSRTRFVQ